MRIERVLVVLAGIMLIFGGLMIGLDLATISADTVAQPTVVQLVDANGQAVKKQVELTVTLNSQVKTCSRSYVYKRCRTISLPFAKKVLTNDQGQYSISTKSYLSSTEADFLIIASLEYKRSYNKEIPAIELEAYKKTYQDLAQKDYFLRNDAWPALKNNLINTAKMSLEDANKYSGMATVLHQIAAPATVTQNGVYTYKTPSVNFNLLNATAAITGNKHEGSPVEISFDSKNYRATVNLEYFSTDSITGSCPCPESTDSTSSSTGSR